MKQRKIAVVGADKLTIKETAIVANVTTKLLQRGVHIFTTDACGADQIVRLICHNNAGIYYTVVPATKRRVLGIEKFVESAVIVGTGQKADILNIKFQDAGKKVKRLSDETKR